MTTTTTPAPSPSPVTDSLPQRAVRVAFVVTLALFLLGGFVLVGAQALELVAGDGDEMLRIAERVGPPTYVLASVCGLLAFVQAYFGPGRGREHG